MVEKQQQQKQKRNNKNLTNLIIFHELCYVYIGTYHTHRTLFTIKYGSSSIINHLFENTGSNNNMK